MFTFIKVRREVVFKSNTLKQNISAIQEIRKDKHKRQKKKLMGIPCKCSTRHLAKKGETKGFREIRVLAFQNLIEYADGMARGSDCSRKLSG
jgi:hypothetical protein